jgi:hypothetical protein
LKGFELIYSDLSFTHYGKRFHLIKGFLAPGATDSRS